MKEEKDLFYVKRVPKNERESFYYNEDLWETIQPWYDEKLKRKVWPRSYRPPGPPPLDLE